MTRIAPLTEADRDEWLPLWHAYLVFYEAELSDELTDLAFARLLDPLIDLNGAIARDDEGRAVGFVHWLRHPGTWTRGPACYLEDLFVDPAARGEGTGRALIAHVRSWAEALGCASVYWHTQESNATARRLYDKVATLTGFVHYEIELASTS